MYVEQPSCFLTAIQRGCQEFSALTALDLWYLEREDLMNKVTRAWTMKWKRVLGSVMCSVWASFFGGYGVQFRLKIPYPVRCLARGTSIGGDHGIQGFFS